MFGGHAVNMALRLADPCAGNPQATRHCTLDGAASADSLASLAHNAIHSNDLNEVQT